MYGAHEETNLPLEAVVLGKILLSQMYVFANFDTAKLSLGHVKPPSERSQVVNAHIVYQDKEEQCDPQQRGLSGTTIDGVDSAYRSRESRGLFHYIM